MDKILQIQDAINRRTFLQRSAAGLGLAALAAIFGDEGYAAVPTAHRRPPPAAAAVCRDCRTSRRRPNA